MNITPESIEQLPDRLMSDDAALLSEEEKAVLSRALIELTASQSVISKQSRLLQLHGELRDRIESVTTETLADLHARLDDHAPVKSFDFAAADAARTELLTAVESANTTRATLAAALGFVRRLIGAAT